MIRSLDELARQADKFLEGEAVIDIDPSDIDGSFVSDRLEDDAEQFEALKAAIAERGPGLACSAEAASGSCRALPDRLRTPACEGS